MSSNWLPIPSNNIDETNYELSYQIQRDYMNSSINERNDLAFKPNYYHSIDKPINTNKNHINQIQNNRLKTIPYKNGSKLIDRKKELKIQSGITTIEKKSLNILSEIGVDNTIPLIPEMTHNLEGHHNIYNFSQVGIISRNLKPNTEYTKKCVNNIKKINKYINNELK